jgi:hypothetical protein
MSIDLERNLLALAANADEETRTAIQAIATNLQNRRIAHDREELDRQERIEAERRADLARRTRTGMISSLNAGP